jgi:OOP family OmpA-OmpF porin
VLEERVLFDFERARVRTRANKVLDAIVRLRSQHPDWGAIQIEGHCDARGDAELNRKLSERRARNVMRKLIEWGIPAEVLSYAGFGATRLLDQGTSEEAHQRNRRVEFVVLTRVAVQRGGSAKPAAPLQVTPLPPAAASSASEPDPDEPEEGEPAPAAAVPARSPLAPQPAANEPGRR